MLISLEDLGEASAESGSRAEGTDRSVAGRADRAATGGVVRPSPARP